ncbi:hypothetical protein BT63DRAFT_300645 [Microthyrium microscopicum]|uniref:Uncharacterized protein n=1 Tax=Microthyrium microscopicum TaxID=703497 RepID=A0A6A6U8Z7_9PEZI|nr:hypothetical protein BT63DRAFT_300645 [Microthyrium microscopicum]
MSYEYASAAVKWVVLAGIVGATVRARQENPRQSTERRNTNTTKARQPKTKSEPSSTASPASSIPISYNDKEEKEDMSWVTELASKKKGAAPSKTAPVRQQDSRLKTVKQSTANKKAAELSGDTSTTGADGDDDRSSANSPDLASTQHVVPVVGDIRDMMEPSSDGPSVLRLTEPETFIPARQKAPKKEAQQPESKKARQNRKKVEERKEAQSEIEKVRKSQMENQRRSAREARGEPAKNGLGAPPANNAWDAKKSAAPHANGTTLLDTFSQETPATAGAEIKRSNGWSSQNLPSEEEQMRILMEDDESAWKTVSKKKTTKRKNTDSNDEEGGAVKPLELLPKSEPTQSIPAESAIADSNDGHQDDNEGWTVA